MTVPSVTAPARDLTQVRATLSDLTTPCWVVRGPDGIDITADAGLAARTEVLTAVGPLPPHRLGDHTFGAFHGVSYAYAAGAMANGIASPAMVTALARAGYLASYGAAGVVPARVDAALSELAATLGELPYACNLIHSPSEPALERAIVDACLRHGVCCVEASAFMDLSPEIVRYRLSGLSTAPDGRVIRAHRVIAKVSRVEVAELFLRPAPAALVRRLLDRGDITAEQARLGQVVPMADDITAEADSGGHTDRRPLMVLLPDLIAARDRIRRDLPELGEVRIGAAGGIGTPAAAAAAFALGAAYVVTGSINQATVEADQSEATKTLLAGAGVADCTMAPSSDMFELGVQVQVLRRGTMFATRAHRLYDTYREYAGIDAIPAARRDDLESAVFRRPLTEVWDECVTYFTERDPAQLAGAADDPKRKMALIFRWYLGLSSGWSIRGENERTADYQIWCGPAMGAFNNWVAGTHLAAPAHRRVADIAHHILEGAAYLTRVGQLRAAGVRLPAEIARYVPAPREER
ncbi:MULTISPECIES: PfaD family polyunsaturated fatty acid/polyketide biosynthesis protein [Rhodococcus]|uniref:PfaD family polyunsaturated fatty acid/polyketide biosynthesis protein n=1 Tax=Rhodococcus TaxID=1827 RepID=UPI0029539904|nr:MULTISPECIES: PfaD family polyunsaturated fatty acid/polyketide biosynthesis protein [Rhodococcus]MDV7246741.1 PfaD family polyunsaturated fatty acid/polyketide biosynthesis protein [Rhodococcus oxybenzonivorans]MDV7337754.1 PfaD family polyunsaturated fatty acid/polyketide biosynthesis protein [Rhodococcus oxybenzonivorans]MDV7347810.1 PfaD family polyunsaturated fatty acid/polyketide biosynthesis protein [Rhodococcus oxybenzonivorans]MDV8031518.1 PfaD family polyunsaturated fatty acid/poly